MRARIAWRGVLLIARTWISWNLKLETQTQEERNSLARREDDVLSKILLRPKSEDFSNRRHIEAMELFWFVLQILARTHLQFCTLWCFDYHHIKESYKGVVSTGKFCVAGIHFSNLRCRIKMLQRSWFHRPKHQMGKII